MPPPPRSPYPQVRIQLLVYLTCFSVYLPSCISQLSRFRSNEFTHCWAQDKINSRWGKASRSCCGKHPLLPALFPRASPWVKVSQWGASPIPKFPSWFLASCPDGRKRRRSPQARFFCSISPISGLGPPWDMEGAWVRGPPLGSSLLQGVMGLKMWVLICLLQARGDWGILRLL